MRGQAAREKREWKGPKGRTGVHSGWAHDYGCKPLLPALMRMAGSVGAWRQGEMINPSQDPVLGHLGGGEQIKKAGEGGGGG